MRSIGRAGWASHGFFGAAAQTFGNPDGATSGGGAWTGVTNQGGDGAALNGFRDGGANINGPNQGGGGGGPPPAGTWVAQVSPTANAIIGAATNGTGDVILLDETGALFQSVNGGAAWTSLGTLATAGSDFTTIAYSRGVWMVACIASTTQTPTLFRSMNNGGTWTQVPSNAKGNFIQLLAGNGAGGWVAMGQNSVQQPGPPTSQSTDDGATFTVSTNNANDAWFGGVVWNGADYVALGSQTGPVYTVATSADGVSWTATAMVPATEQLGSGLAFSGTGYMAGIVTGANNIRIASTPAGLTTAADVSVTPLSGGISTVAWIDSVFLAADNNGGMASSAGGLVWTGETLNFQAGDFCDAIVYDPTHAVAIAFGGASGSISTRAN